MPVGNYLRKTRTNFHISADCIQMIQELSHREGLSGSGVIEQAVRKMYRACFGEAAKPETPRQIGGVRRV